MRPPICDFCGESFVHDAGSGKLLRFKLSPEGERRNAEMQRTGMVGHPSGAHWACKVHTKAAQEMTHLPFSDARDIVLGKTLPATIECDLEYWKGLPLPKEVILAGPAQAANLARITADAFWDDPVNAWIFQSQKGMHHAFSALAKYVYVPNGMGHIIPGKAAAMWAVPGGKTELPLRSMISLSLAATLYGGIGAMSRIFAFDKAAAKAHPRAPHLYLFTVGVRPEFKGKGFGKRLLSPVLNAADEKGLPIYLENSKPENHGFYRSLGFERQEIFHPKPDAPPLEAMWRKPRLCNQV